MKLDSIRSALGLSQAEMARLLGISRSHWSMYELGRRSLPTGAAQTLAGLLPRMNAPEGRKKTPGKEGPESDSRGPVLERLLRDNEYRRAILDRKIDTLRRKLEKRVSRERFREIAAKNPKPAKAQEKAPEFRISQATVAKNERPELLAEYEIRRELLEVQREWLESKLKG
jgi:transcriptional regulator with XRE-family HTH domain